MKMKKVLCTVLSIVCILSMTACGTDKGSEKAAKDDSKKADTAIKTVDDLEGKKIGVQLGTTGDLFITGDLEDEGKAKVERYNKGFEAVQALQQGKVDAVVIDDQPAKTFVNENEGLKILETAYTEEDYALCFKKDNELVGKFNEAIKGLKEDGTFDKIVASYVGTTAGSDFYEVPADADTSKGELVMATNAEFPPYEFHEGDQIKGIDADFARAIANKLGMSLKIEDMAFDSIITAVQGGKADFGAAGMTVTEERKAQVDFTDTYYTGVQVIIVNDK